MNYGAAVVELAPNVLCGCARQSDEAAVNQAGRTAVDRAACPLNQTLREVKYSSTRSDAERVAGVGRAGNLNHTLTGAGIVPRKDLITAQAAQVEDRSRRHNEG